MRVYGLKNCDTCRKVMKTLQESGKAVDFVDVRADGLSAADIRRFHAVFGDRLVNTRSTTWRGLSEDDRARNSLELLAEHPALMKRPVIEGDGQLTLGWSADVAGEWLGK